MRAPGKQLIVETFVHAAGTSADETRALLNGMKWVRSTDSKGRPEVVLSYPVDDYRGFAYPRAGQVDVDLPGWLSWLEDAGHTSTFYRGERVRIYGRPKASAPILYANLRIFVPLGAEMAVRNVVGSVRVGNLEGTLRVDTGSGDIHLASHVGNLDLDTGSGDVLVRNGAASHVLADTGSGSVQVLGVELVELDADTGSGDVVVRSSLGQAKRVTADTGSGDVTIHAGSAASFDIESSQGSGELLVRYDDARIRRDGRKVVGAELLETTLKTGDTLLLLRTLLLAPLVFPTLLAPKLPGGGGYYRSRIPCPDDSEIARVVSAPITADAEGGYADDPAEVGENIAAQRL